MNEALALTQNLGLVLLLGGTFARRWWPESLSSWALGLGLALLLTGAVGSVAWSLNQFGLPLAQELPTFLLDEPAGRSLTLGLIGALVLLAGELSRWPLPVLVPPTLLLLYGPAAQGHAALHGPPTLSAQMAHLAAMSIWLGGVLALALRRDPQPAELDRMTTPALLCLLTLALTGSFAATLHGGPPPQLFASEYGRMLAFKLLTLAAALGAAGGLRWQLYRSAPVQVALRSELAFLLGVLVLSSVLGEINPHS